MAFHVYVLRSLSTGRFYVGHTRRISEHNKNRTTSIKNRGPWAFFYSEEYATRSEASRREREIKQMKSRPYIEALACAEPSDLESR